MAAGIGEREKRVSSSAKTWEKNEAKRKVVL